MASETYTGTMTVLTCCVCGVAHGLPTNYASARRNDHQSWHCPNGHKQYFFGKSDAELQRERADRAEARAIRMQDERDTAERRRRAEKAAKTKIKNRVAKGVCPCCNRTFQNLADHMKSKHPDYAD